MNQGDPSGDLVSAGGYGASPCYITSGGMLDLIDVSTLYGRAEYAYRYLTEITGFDPVEAAAAVGNLQVESGNYGGGLSPQAVQLGCEDPGYGDNCGAGIAMWGGGRFLQLLKFAGIPATATVSQGGLPDFQTQVAFVSHELQQNIPNPTLHWMQLNSDNPATTPVPPPSGLCGRSSKMVYNTCESLFGATEAFEIEYEEPGGTNTTTPSGVENSIYSGTTDAWDSLVGLTPYSEGGVSYGRFQRAEGVFDAFAGEGNVFGVGINNV